MEDTVGNLQKAISECSSSRLKINTPFITKNPLSGTFCSFMNLDPRSRSGIAPEGAISCSGPRLRESANFAMLRQFWLKSFEYLSTVCEHESHIDHARPYGQM